MALKMYPGVNGQIEGDNLIYHDYADVGIAVFGATDAAKAVSFLATSLTTSVILRIRVTSYNTRTARALAEGSLA